MLHTAVSRYHELLTENDLAESSRAMLDDGLERARLVFGGRRLSPYLRPHFVTEEDWARVTRICETVWSAIQKVKDASLEDEALLSELGLTAKERELVAIDPGYREVAPTARLDSFLTDDAYSFVELNGESPAGIAYADAAYEIFSALPVMRRFAEEYDVRALYGRGQMLDVLLRAHAEFLGRKADHPPHIAIVDLKDVPTTQEFELFKEFFESQGHPSIICSPDALQFTDGRLRHDDFEIDIVYKRLLVNEFIPIIDESPALLDAYRAGAFCLVNSFRSKLVHKKAIFSVLTDERHARLFSVPEREAIRKHVPWTRRVSAAKSDYFGQEIDLLEFIMAKRDRLVLKPNDDYGGAGIVLGWEVDGAAWSDAIRKATTEPFIVQQRIGLPSESFPSWADGALVFADRIVDTAPFVFQGAYADGCLTRVSTASLVNVTAGGGSTVPTFVVEKR